MLFFEPQNRDRSLFPHDPFKAMIVPRLTCVKSPRRRPPTLKASTFMG